MALLTLELLTDHVQQVLSYGDTATNVLGGHAGVDETLLVNLAGRHFCSMHPWNFLLRTPKRVDFTAPIAFTNATWSTSAKTLTGTFTGYSFTKGDEVTLSTGTGLNTATNTYPLAGGNATVLTLEDDIGSPDTTADIGGQLEFPYANLPSDFGEMVAYDMESGLNYGFEFATPDKIVRLRATTITVSQNYFWGTIVHPGQSGVSAAVPTPRIEIWPTPQVGTANVMTIFYRSKWTDLSVTSDVAEVPYYAELPLIQVVRALAEGWANDVNFSADADERLSRITGSSIFKTAMLTDGMQQPDYGPIEGGTIQEMTPSFSWRSAGTLSGPA